MYTLHINFGKNISHALISTSWLAWDQAPQWRNRRKHSSEGGKKIGGPTTRLTSLTDFRCFNSFLSSSPPPNTEPAPRQNHDKKLKQLNKLTRTIARQKSLVPYNFKQSETELEEPIRFWIFPSPNNDVYQKSRSDHRKPNKKKVIPGEENCKITKTKQHRTFLLKTYNLLFWTWEFLLSWKKKVFTRWRITF